MVGKAWSLVFLKDYAFFDWLYFSFMKPLGLFIKWLLAMEFDIFETSFLNLFETLFNNEKRSNTFILIE